MRTQHASPLQTRLLRVAAATAAAAAASAAVARMARVLTARDCVLRILRPACFSHT